MQQKREFCSDEVNNGSQKMGNWKRMIRARLSFAYTQIIREIRLNADSFATILYTGF